MRRFYLPPDFAPALNQEIFVLEGQQARHMAQVLRLRAGDEVEFFDGSGQVLRARLHRIEQGRISLALTERRREPVPAYPPLTLALALLKGNKMDLVVQKANELGVHAFLPLVTKFCEKRGGGGAASARWQRIVIESCKQCKRTIPMQIGPSQPVPSLTESDFSWAALRLVAWEDEQHAGLPLATLKANTGPICLLIGPEGGLHREELAWLGEQGFHSFSLGGHVLRAETAAIAAVAIVQHLCGALQPQIS